MPKKITKEELEKLPLRERLEKLREIVEEDKEDLEKTEKLIKKTERELITEEASTDTGPAQEPESIEDIAEEAPPSPEEKKVEAEAAKYESYKPDYTAAAKPPEPEDKLEEVFEYKMAHDDAVKSTGTKTIDKDIKKYSKG